MVKHRIDTGNARTIQQNPRRLSEKQKKESEKHIKKMREQKIMISSESESSWRSSNKIVSKKNVSTCFCVDYHQLNTVTLKDSYPISRIDEILHKLADSHWFSILDFTSGYFQVEVETCDRSMTDYVMRGGLYEFCMGM